MKKLKLKTEYSFDFHLIGIVSSAKNYSVSWGIGQALGIELARVDDLELEISGVNMLIPCYQFESNFVRYSLVSNKILTSHDQTVRHLVPSLSHFDFFLKIEELEEIDDVNQVFVKLREAQKIDTIAKLDILNIKEREYLLF